MLSEVQSQSIRRPIAYPVKQGRFGIPPINPYTNEPMISLESAEFDPEKFVEALFE